jgi:hypothetical protein
MSAIRFFTDEDVYGAIAQTLRKVGIDAVSTPEAGRLGQSDESQLDWAVREGRALLTFNVGHFSRLHASWLQQGRSHAGLVVSEQRPVGDVLQRLRNLAATLDAAAMRDRLEFLGDW